MRTRPAPRPPRRPRPSSFPRRRAATSAWTAWRRRSPRCARRSPPSKPSWEFETKFGVGHRLQRPEPWPQSRAVTRLALALLVLAALPAAASAAPFGELPPLTVKRPGRCLPATGAPGEVARWAPDGAELVQATASGFGASVHVKLGQSYGECPIVVAQPSGAAAVVQLLEEGIGVAVRAPGGSFGPVQTLGTPDAPIDDPVAAVNPRGDVVVGW